MPREALMPGETLFFDPAKPDKGIVELLEREEDVSGIGLMIKDALQRHQKIYGIGKSVFAGMKIITMEMKMRLDCMVERDGKYWFSQCPQFDIASQGRTKEEAISNLKASIEIFLEDKDSRVHKQYAIPFVPIEIANPEKPLCHGSHLCQQRI